MGRGGEENSFKGQFLLYVREITKGLTSGRGKSSAFAEKAGRLVLRTFPNVCGSAQQSCAPAGTLSSSMSRCGLPSFSAERSMPLEGIPIILRGGRFRMATTVLPTSSSGR